MRDDLKAIKADHFRKSYSKQLAIPKATLDNCHYGSEKLDAGKYFAMKYYLREEEKMTALKAKVHEINKMNARLGDGTSPKSAANVAKGALSSFFKDTQLKYNSFKEMENFRKD